MIRTRICPSPTGQDIHIGSLYTALVNYSYALKTNGTFIVRIEDTDRTRFVPGAEEQFLATFNAYGVKYEEGPDKGGPHGPYRQSDRLDIYKKYAEQLVENGHAYYSFCPKEELDELRKHDKPTFRKLLRDPSRAAFSKQDAENRISAAEEYVIRLMVPENKDITFTDVIRGDITINTGEIDDQVVLKSDGFPTYHLAVVVDDYLMKITHVIRAEEWISSVPKHVLIYQGLGWELPVFAHLPLLRNADRSKLSKRKNAVWASWYLEQGFLPQAVCNYLMLMGWSHPEEKEVFSLDEFVSLFDLDQFEPVGPVFDPVKLEWMNGVYIRQMEQNELKDLILSFSAKNGQDIPAELVAKTIPLIQERIKKLSDYWPLCAFFFKDVDEHEIEITEDAELLQKIAEKIESIADADWKADYIGEQMLAVAQEEGVKNKKFFQLLRVAITGKKISPPLNESMEILGKEVCSKRVWMEGKKNH